MQKHQDIKKAAKRFLDSEAVMFLATSSSTGIPHAAAVFFSADDEFRLSFVTRANTRKAMNILENPKVAFSIGEHPPMNVQGGGTATIVTGDEERREVFDRIADKAAERKDVWPPIFQFPGEYMVLAIEPEWMRMLDLEGGPIAGEEPPLVDILT